ncbi:DNA translocase FtsK [Deinococcus planocerae]|uniref:DNA translocase FtsK n=1 Tax=Deinococcus planocerae TaxID=1737569 RepID=UPI000C7EA942|nr:DNA translocase FtsK [Deinococcus planocerae]
MAKARAKSAPPASRFDGEALGLVLFALGIFLAVTLTLPQIAESGFMTQARAVLTGWLGWGAYLLPVVPIAYGVLVFLGRDLKGLTRRVLGGVVVVASLLALHEVFSPGAAGEGAARLMGPLVDALGYAAVLFPLVTLTLGLEIMLRLRPLTLLKGLFRRLSVLLGGATTRVQGVIETRQEGREAARARAGVRQGLAAQARDVETLRRLYPEARELGGLDEEVRAARREVRGLDESGLKGMEGELGRWREGLSTFARGAARDLREAVSREAPDAGAQAEAVANEVRAGRHELSIELPSTLASGALERLRRNMVADLQRLAGRAGKLERERQAALKALGKADAATLTRELPAWRERERAWRDLAEDFTAWRERERHYPGWPDLAAAFDRAPTEIAATLAEALAGDPDGTLSTQEEWRARLARAQEEALERVQLMAVGSTETPALDFDFTGEAPARGGTVNLSEEKQPTPLSPPPSTTVIGAVPPRASEPLLGSSGVQASAPSRRAAQATLEEEDDESAAPWESAKPERRRPAQGAVDLALPGYDLLDPLPVGTVNPAQLDVAARQRAAVIDQTLRHFGLQARVVDFARGPTVTRYEIEPAPGEKISRIASLSNDLARALAVGGVRVEAPVPGKSVIGLEVPNTEREPVTFHQAAASSTFRGTRAKLPIILGKSIDGELMVGDLAKMPHLLIAGSTGSGKSVCVNTLITSLLYRYLPTELRFLMVDPKMVELTPYDGIPHLVRPVVTNPMDAAGVLFGGVAHMERRYKMMSQVGAKNLEQYNAKMRQVGDAELPHLVIIIDELADLMITSPKEVESAIMRLAQMARATGMHLVLATQRPSVDILTSLIKVNVPARVAFAVSSSHDSRTILDSVGAERLTGMGDMLFYQPGLIKPLRLQGPYISEVESARITDELRRQVFDDVFVEEYGADFDGTVSASGPTADKANMDFSDPHLRQAALICIEEGQGSVSRLQRRLSVGHARAGKLMDMLEAMGIVSKHQGSKPREVLITEADLPEYFGR